MFGCSDNGTGVGRDGDWLMKTVIGRNDSGEENIRKLAYRVSSAAEKCFWRSNIELFTRNNMKYREGCRVVASAHQRS